VAKFWLKHKAEKAFEYLKAKKTGMPKLGIYHLQLRNSKSRVDAGATKTETTTLKMLADACHCSLCMPRSQAHVASIRSWCPHKLALVCDQNLDISPLEQYAKKENAKEKREREKALLRKARRCYESCYSTTCCDV